MNTCLGTKIHQVDLQREKDKKALNQLRSVAGEFAKGFDRFDPQHALTHVINPALIDLSSLTKDPTTGFKRVKWNPENDETATTTQYAGFHRVTVFKEFFEETTHKYEAACRNLAKYPSNVKYVEEKAQYLEILLREGTWLIAFCDGQFILLASLLQQLTPLKERFLSDEKKAQTVRIQLARINIVSSHPDGALHRFDNIARTLSACRDAEDRNTLLAHVQSEMPGDVQNLLRNHMDAIDLFVNLHIIPAFAKHGLRPKQLLDAKKIMWGVSIPSFLYYWRLTSLTDV